VNELERIQMRQQRVSSEVGTKLLFENDRVRVWDLCLPPGQGSGLHRHENDYLYVVIGDGVLQRVDPDGSRAEPKAMRDGQVVFREVGDDCVHEAVNAGEAMWRNIVVELKDEKCDG